MTSTIAIVGAGLGGLVLARVLQKYGIRAMIYELDAAAEGEATRVLDKAGTLFIDQAPKNGEGGTRIHFSRIDPLTRLLGKF
jgi:2-polyprenyl-6-methoxyphenol hydroxylase-like FAD-dependent oxidoreductase